MAPFRSIAISAAAAFTHPHTSATTKCVPRCSPLTPPLPSFTSLRPDAQHFITLSTATSVTTTTQLHIASPINGFPKIPIPHNGEALFYMFLLALQFGLQPVLTKRFTPKTINRSTVVFSQDVVKFFMAGTVLFLTGGWAEAVAGLSIKSWLTIAGVPAALYCVQNMATLIAYQNLAPLTFNVLNQTKTLSAALCCFLLMGKVQSKVQILSLLLLFTSACVIEKIIPLRRKVDDKQNENETLVTQENSGQQHIQGVSAVLLASFISGLAGALVQKNLQSGASGGGRNSYLFTMELCVASLIVLCTSMLKSEDGKRIRSEGFFKNWTPQTFIPILTNAAGGIVVGLVTKHAGAVKKGFALIFGLLLSGVLQAFMNGDNDGGPKLSVEQIFGGILAALSLWMHSAFPA